jgi:N-acetylmuramoyl-L-alanine amidase
MPYLGRTVLFAIALASSARPARADPVLTVVIDPGHGGSNLGARGCDGVLEKQFTLAVARRVKRALEQRGAKVILTRERDAYLTLGERVRRANGAGADLFLSIHGNASPEHARRGFEAYVAAREVADVAADRAAASAPDAASAMAERARARFVAAESARLARAVQARMGEVRTGDRGVRQAPYDVLDGVKIPAALVEVGFIDHPDEGRELLDAKVVATIAAAIADGAADFVARRTGAIAQR